MSNSLNSSFIYDSEGKDSFLTDATLNIASDGTSEIGSASEIAPEIDDFEDIPEHLTSNGLTISDKSPLLRHVILHSVSSQLDRLKDRATLGRPTAIAVSSFLAVGTSNGVTLIFDTKQVLKCCLVDSRLRDFGSVSCLSYSASGDRLIAGFASGHIALWDIVNNRLLCFTSDFHLPDCPVLHIRFTSLPSVVVLSDSSGSIFALSFSGKNSSSCSSRLLFSGSRGEALYFDVLTAASLQHHIRKLPFVDTVVVVIVTVSSIIISTVSPSHGSICKILRADFKSSTFSAAPSSCWSPTINPTDSVFEEEQTKKRQENFVFRLCVGREKKLKFFLLSGSKKSAQLSVSHWGDVTTDSMNIKSNIMGTYWPKADYLLMLDEEECLHVISTTTMGNSVTSLIRLHAIDISNVRLLYSSGSFFKAAATGSAVSQAMSSLGDHACYSSITCSNSQIFMLGMTGVHVLTPRALADRVKQLAECGDRLAAVQVLVNVHKGPASVRPSWLFDRMLDLLVEIASLNITDYRPSDLSSFTNLLNLCFEKLIDRSDIFSLIASNLNVPALKNALTQQVINYVKKHDLDIVPVNFFPPQVSQIVFDSLTGQRNCLEDLSSFLCFVDVTSVDLDRAIRFSYKNGLYTPYIRLYWEALLDWRTPLVALLDIVVISQVKLLTHCIKEKKPLPSLTSLASSTATRSSFSLSPAKGDTNAAISVVLDYIDCLLARLFYPSRKPCPFFSEENRLEAFDVLCSRIPSTGVIAEIPEPSEKQEIPLSFNTFAYLKALILAAPDRALTLLSAVLDSAAASSEDSSWESRRQLLMDIIFEILESISDTSDAVEMEITPIRLACYTFAVQELTVSAGRKARLYGDSFTMLVQGLLGIVAEPRAEAALFVLFRSGFLDEYCSDAELLAMAERSQFFDLAAAVCLKHDWRARMLRYYFQVPAWISKVYEFLAEAIAWGNEPGHGKERNALLESCCSFANELVACDSTRAARFVVDCIWGNVKRREAFLERLRQSSPRNLYILLIRIRTTLDSELMIERVALTTEIECERYVQSHLTPAIDYADSLARDHNDVDVVEDDDQIDSCVRALPNEAYPMCLEQCALKRSRADTKLGRNDPSIEGSFAECLVLLELGELNQAIEMSLKIIKCWFNLIKAHPKSPWFASKLDMAVRRFIRISAKAKSLKPEVTPEVSPNLLAELFCILQTEATSSPRLSSVVSALCSVFSASVVVEAVLKASGTKSLDSNRQNTSLGSIRSLLTAVLKLSGDEIESYTAMQGVYAYELDQAYTHFRATGSRGIRLNATRLRCSVCRRPPDEGEMNIFCCDHTVHPDCCKILSDSSTDSSEPIPKASSVPYIQSMSKHIHKPHHPKKSEIVSPAIVCPFCHMASEN